MFDLVFANRLEAGRALADELAGRNSAGPAIVLALTRGGAPVGFAVAERLRLPLDVIIARKIGVPWHPELAIGAIAGPFQLLDEQMIWELGISQEEVEAVVAREMSELKRRETLYRDGRAPLNLAGKIAVIVDDGLATGSTMLAATRYAASLNPAGLAIGVPVGSAQACSMLREEAEVVCLSIPHPFCAVGEWYRDFDQVSDNEVRSLLARNRQQMEVHPVAT
jgi:predicted phosphoribosyltransferase